MPPPLAAAAAAPAAPTESTLDSAFSSSADAPVPQVGQPSRLAADSISLDSVFGDEGGRGSGPHGTTAAPRPSGGPGGFSFDDFFGGSAPGGAPAAGAAGAAGAAKAPGAPGAPSDAKSAAPKAPAGGRGRPGAEDEGDLDQFQSWLKGLKG